MLVPPRLLIYEPNAGGHQAEFLTWLAEAWVRHGAPGPLVLAAPVEVTVGRPALVEACAASGGFVTLVVAEAAAPPRTTLANAVALHRARPLQQALARYGPEHALLMSFEHFMAPLAARVWLPGAANVSALTLRPTLHYDALGGARSDGRARAVRWARTRVVGAAMRHPRFGTLFSLDPTAVPALRALGRGVRVKAVPDPVPGESVTLTREAVRNAYGIEAHRRLFVLPGALDSRKGALVVARALLALPSEAAARAAVLFAGRVQPAIEDEFRALLDRAQRETAVQVVLRDSFVPPNEIQAHVAAADAVLLLYNAEHVGSSGFLMRAAGAGVPVLCTGDGLMGYLTRTHRLGRTSPPEPDATARALTRVITSPFDGFDREAAAAFAAGHTVEAFTSALLRPFLEP